MNACRGVDGCTPLQSAAENSPTPVVLFLLESGANPGATDERGWTALHFACTSTESAGSVENVRALILAGAPISHASETGSTPLWLAAQNNHIALVLLLCESGADVNAPKYSETEGGFMIPVSPLDIALMKKNKMVVALLKKHGAVSLLHESDKFY